MSTLPKIENSSLLRLDQRSAAALAAECVLSPDAARLLSPSLGPAAFIAKLLDRQLWTDALQVLAHALPQRSSIWWGCLCAWHASAKEQSLESERRELELAGRWVLDPAEEHRLHSADGTTPERMRRPSGCLIAAVGHAAAERPKPEFVGHLVGAAVLMAAGKGDDLRQEEFVAWGIYIGNQELGWMADEGVAEQR